METDETAASPYLLNEDTISEDEHLNDYSRNTLWIACALLALVCVNYLKALTYCLLQKVTGKKYGM